MCWRWNGEKTNSEKTAWGEPGRFVEFFSGESIAFPAKSSGVENVPLKRRIGVSFAPCSRRTSRNMRLFLLQNKAEQQSEQLRNGEGEPHARHTEQSGQQEGKDHNRDHTS